jgi:hypothetical protein
MKDELMLLKSVVSVMKMKEIKGVNLKFFFVIL